MATEEYITGRFKYARPQAILWADAVGSGSGEFQLAVPGGSEYSNFIILSDHNRSEIRMGKTRLENRQRMINGSMRSYHIADKTNISLSWEMLPSRAYSIDPDFSSVGVPDPNAVDYTADGGAGGVELLEWYENHPGPFWMLMAYDKYNSFTDVNARSHLDQYSQLLKVYFTNFEYTIVKRGANYDFWNISVELEEV